MQIFVFLHNKNHFTKLRLILLDTQKCNGTKSGQLENNSDNKDCISLYYTGTKN